jgi:Arc/MetJ-type ribon-helix-helix transcriptional regulator
VPQQSLAMKKPISATIDRELIDWVRKKVEKERRKYRNKSHLIEVALELLRKEEEGRKK